MYRTRLTLKPGAPGTQQLVHEFGARLLCVRYRYDAARHVRIKTVELIVDEKPWTPPAEKPEPLDDVHVQVPLDDLATRHAITRLGGTWLRETQTFRLTYAAATLLCLNDHIVSPAARE